jgi:hypothetical protein
MPLARPLDRAAVLEPVKAEAPSGGREDARPALTDPARGGCQSCGRDRRMLAARVKLKNGQ